MSGLNMFGITLQVKVFDAIKNNEDIGAVIWIENNKLFYHEDLIKLYKTRSKNSLLISSKKLQT